MTRLARKPMLAVLVVLALGIAAIPIAAAAPDVIIPGDPAEYRRRIDTMLAGGLPYLDVPFEHLPVMLLPMLAAWLLGGSASQSAFIVIFAMLMALTLAVTGPVLGRIGRRLDAPATVGNWLLTVIPLVPLVVFRNDPFVVLLFVLAVYLYIADRRGWTVIAAVGSFAKVWPAALAVAVWPGRRAASLWLAGSGILAALLTWLPGFTDARRALGIHAETTVGALLGAARAVSGSDIGLQVTTAAYLEVGLGALVFNALIGVAVVGLGVATVVPACDDRQALLGLGTIVAGIILASQLLSLQYALWLTPFLALSGRRRTVLAGFGLAVLTGVLAWIWRTAHFEEVWFYGLLTVRNLTIIVIAVWLAAEARSATTT